MSGRCMQEPFACMQHLSEVNVTWDCCIKRLVLELLKNLSCPNYGSFKSYDVRQAACTLDF